MSGIDADHAGAEIGGGTHHALVDMFLQVCVTLGIVCVCM